MAEKDSTTTPTEYIAHHLTNLTFGKRPDGSWGFANSAEEVAQMGFWSVHVDSLAWAVGLGLVFLLMFWFAARRATAGVPGMFQSAIEAIVEFCRHDYQGHLSTQKPLGGTDGTYHPDLGVLDEPYGLGSCRLGAEYI